VNWVAILVAAMTVFIVGMLWYSPLLFGKQWMKLAGMTEADAKKGNMAASMFFGFVSNVVMAYVLSLVFAWLGNVTDLQSALFVAGLMWLGFVGTVSLGSVLWEKKPLSLYVLNNAYSLLTMLLMGGILVSWPA
jgi:hypothetical protein